MGRLTSLFKKIDELIFKQVDQFKGLSAYQESLTKLETLPDDKLKMINQVISYTLITIPFIILLFAFLFYSSVKSDISLKSDILQKIQEINSKKREVTHLARSILSPGILQSRNDFEGKIRSILGQNSIDSSKVQVGKFSEDGGSGEILKSSAELTFKRLSTQNLSQFLKGVMVNQRMKINRIEAKLDFKKSILQGSLEIIHYGKKIKKLN